MHTVLIVFIVVTGAIIGFYIDQHGDIDKAKAGLQECVIKSPRGNTLIVWQKECK